MMGLSNTFSAIAQFIIGEREDLARARKRGEDDSELTTQTNNFVLG
ncbi:hypothetical protein [Euhalothece natronophila]|nr:hypothetical protein [Euhalothece natronophila]